MCSLCFTGLLHSKHSFSGAVSRPAPSEGHPCPSEDLSPCHTAGRAHCWVGTTLITAADAGCPCSRTVVWYPSSSFFFFHLQITTAWPSERRWVLLLEDNRLPFWGQLPLQTHSWSERHGQEALAALKSAWGRQAGLKGSTWIGPGSKGYVIIPEAEWTRAARRIRRRCSVCLHHLWPPDLHPVVTLLCRQDVVWRQWLLLSSLLGYYWVPCGNHVRKWKCWKPEAASVLSSSHAKGERVRLLGTLSPRLVPTQGSVPPAPAHAVLQTKDLPADGPSISVPQRFSHLQASRASSHLIPHRLNGLENFTCSFIPQVFPFVCLSVKKW